MLSNKIRIKIVYSLENTALISNCIENAYAKSIWDGWLIIPINN